MGAVHTVQAVEQFWRYVMTPLPVSPRDEAVVISTENLQAVLAEGELGEVLRRSLASQGTVRAGETPLRGGG